MNLTDHCVERYFQRTRRKSIKRFKKLLMEKKDEIIKYDIHSNHFHTNYVRNVVQNDINKIVWYIPSEQLYLIEKNQRILTCIKVKKKWLKNSYLTFNEILTSGN